jgi:hypothetical protein
MKKLLLAILISMVGAACSYAQVNPPSGQITAATTNATCVGGTQNGGAVDLTVPQTSGAAGISVTGTWSATLNIQLSTDHGRTWTASGGTFTANQQSVVAIAGYSDVCVFASAYTSGTAIVTFATSNATPSSAGGSGASSTQVQGAGASGVAAVGNPVLVAGRDAASGNVFAIPLINGGTGVLIGLSVAGTDAQANTPIQLYTPGGSTFNLGIDSYLFNGSTWDRSLTCPNTSTFSVVSTTTQVIAASGSTKIRICSFDINPATVTAGSTDIVYGTGANCGTGTTTLTGAYTLPAAAVVDITPATLSSTSPLTTPASQAVCVRAVTSTVNGFIVWEQH